MEQNKSFFKLVRQKFLFPHFRKVPRNHRCHCGRPGAEDADGHDEVGLTTSQPGLGAAESKR